MLAENSGHSLMELLLAQSDRNQDNGFSIEGASSALPDQGGQGIN